MSGEIYSAGTGRLRRAPTLMHIAAAYADGAMPAGCAG